VPLANAPQASFPRRDELVAPPPSTTTMTIRAGSEVWFSMRCGRSAV